MIHNPLNFNQWRIYDEGNPKQLPISEIYVKKTKSFVTIEKTSGKSGENLHKMS